MQPLDEFLKLFLIVFAIAMVVAMVMPISLWTHLGKKEGSRWVQNFLSTTLFLLAFFPSAAGLVAVAYAENGDLIAHGMLGRYTIAVLPLLLVIAFVVTYFDFMTLDAAPFLLNDREGQGARVRTLETQLRLNRGTMYDSPEAREYAELVKPFASYGGVRVRGNWLSWVLLALNLTGAALVTCMVFGLFVLASTDQHSIDQEAALRRLGGVYQLFLFWFPLRLYTNWYQFSPYRQTILGRQTLVLGLAIVSLVIPFFIWHAYQPGTSRYALITLTGISTLITLLGSAGKLPIESINKGMREAMHMLQEAHFSIFLMVGTILLLISTVFAKDLVHPALPVPVAAAHRDSTANAGPTQAGSPRPHP